MTQAPSASSSMTGHGDVETEEPSAPAKLRLGLNGWVGLISALIAAYCFLGSKAAGEQLKYFPPFRAECSANTAHNLGWEYNNIAHAIVSNRGYSDPFPSHSGPTAWMPPLITLLLVGLIHITGDSYPAMMAAWLALQVVSVTLCFGFVRRMLPGRPDWVILVVFGSLLSLQFNLTFQSVHDYSLIMLMLNGCFYWDFRRDPLAGRRSTILWGLLGGAIVLTSPVVALVWGGLTLRRGARRGARRHLLLAAAVSALLLAPWIVRNAVVFGRFIPVKSNLFFEFSQSHFDTPDGVLVGPMVLLQPASEATGTALREEYVAKGEMAFVDEHKVRFLAAVRSDPGEFVRRVAHRFSAACFDYRPTFDYTEPGIPGLRACFRLTHALPGIACLILLAGSPWRRLDRFQTTAVAAYIICLAPYVLISYCERYAYPLLGLKTLFVVWALERILPKQSPLGRSS